MTVKLPSGREIDPNDGYVGLSDDLRVGDGYDSQIYDAGFEDIGIDPDREQWPAEDKVALAEIMIERWQRYKQSALLGRPLPPGHSAPLPTVTLLVECQMTNPPRPKAVGVIDEHRRPIAFATLESLRKCVADLDRLEAEMVVSPQNKLERHRTDE